MVLMGGQTETHVHMADIEAIICTPKEWDDGDNGNDDDGDNDNNNNV